jgi:hypothetical protein
VICSRSRDDDRTGAPSLGRTVHAGEGVKQYDGDSGSATEISRLWQAIEKSVVVINSASEKAAIHRLAA